MTVSSSTNKVQYNGNGSTTVFAYTFKIFNQNDLTVIIRSASGTETVKAITTHYTVSGVGSAGGGNITMLTAPVTGETITILREQDLIQEFDLVPNDPFPAQLMEDALDKLTFMVQQHSEELDRSIKASRTNAIGSTEITVSAADRANKIFGFDGAGELAVTQELGTYRGNWGTATAYKQRDLVKDTSDGNIYICIVTHTATGSQPISTNADVAKWELIVDAASATTLSGALLASNNLSELNNKNTALQNLGLTATATELNYVDGVTSAIQTQMDAKAPLASPALTGTPTAPTAAVGTNTTQIATTAFVLANTLNEQTFTGIGANTWTKPANANLVLVRVWGAGGGGAGGAVGAAATLKHGGGGGGGGAYYEKWFLASQLSSTVTVTVGAGGSGGASATGGVAGGTTSFGAHITCAGGGAGQLASVTNAGGSAQAAGIGSNFLTIPTLSGGSNSAAYYGGAAGGQGTVSAGFNSQFGGGGGGSGGGESAANALNQPRDGGQSSYNVGGLAGASGAGVPAAGSPGLFPGCGGGGGGSSQTANGGAGGDGGLPAGGGGGGGSTRTGFLGGTGGAGANGYVEVYTW